MDQDAYIQVLKQDFLPQLREEETLRGHKLTLEEDGNAVHRY